MADKDALFDLIRDDVIAALAEPDHSMRMTKLRDAAAGAFSVAYSDAGGTPDGYDIDEANFLNTLNAAATHTQPDGTDAQVDRVAVMLATAASNAAVVAAAEPGTEFEWVTMLDDRVRDTHRPLHGEVRAAGTPFIVGGVPLEYPGQPVGPPEVWINCRCTLHAAITASAGEGQNSTDNGTVLTAWAKSTSPPGTHDAPGWITNPRETQRLRTYWTKGEGAAKIRWGQPGDFDRCRKQLAKYIPNQTYLAGTCANLHHVALGYWPNQGPHAGKHGSRKADGECTECEDFDPENTTPQGAEVTAAFSAIAELDEMRPPREWFADPAFDAVTPITVTDDGEVLGHIGRWDQCHVGFGEDNCVPPPHSTRDYNHFRTGYVRTAAGDVAVGNLTLGTGHAADGINAASAVAHYDNTGTAVADVAAGEDDFGIWVHGMLRPGVTAAQVHALRAGTPSGDWRTIGGQYEMVAALIVNVPGFPITRPHETLAASGEPLSLVAAGLVTRDPNAIDVERIALAVVHQLDERERKASVHARTAALRSQINGPRVAELIASVEAVRS